MPPVAVELAQLAALLRAAWDALMAAIESAASPRSGEHVVAVLQHIAGICESGGCGTMDADTAYRTAEDLLPAMLVFAVGPIPSPRTQCAAAQTMSALIASLTSLESDHWGPLTTRHRVREALEVALFQPDNTGPAVADALCELLFVACAASVDLCRDVLGAPDFITSLCAMCRGAAYAGAMAQASFIISTVTLMTRVDDAAVVLVTCGVHHVLLDLCGMAFDADAAPGLPTGVAAALQCLTVLTDQCFPAFFPHALLDAALMRRLTHNLLQQCPFAPVIAAACTWLRLCIEQASSLVACDFGASPAMTSATGGASGIGNAPPAAVASPSPMGLSQFQRSDEALTLRFFSTLINDCNLGDALCSAAFGVGGSATATGPTRVPAMLCLQSLLLHAPWSLRLRHTMATARNGQLIADLTRDIAATGAASPGEPPITPPLIAAHLLALLCVSSHETRLFVADRLSHTLSPQTLANLFQSFEYQFALCAQALQHQPPTASSAHGSVPSRPYVDGWWLVDDGGRVANSERVLARLREHAKGGCVEVRGVLDAQAPHAEVLQAALFGVSSSVAAGGAAATISYRLTTALLYASVHMVFMAAAHAISRRCGTHAGAVDCGEALALTVTGAATSSTSQRQAHAEGRDFSKHMALLAALAHHYDGNVHRLRTSEVEAAVVTRREHKIHSKLPPKDILFSAAAQATRTWAAADLEAGDVVEFSIDVFAPNAAVVAAFVQAERAVRGHLGRLHDELQRVPVSWVRRRGLLNDLYRTVYPKLLLMLAAMRTALEPRPLSGSPRSSPMTRKNPTGLSPNADGGPPSSSAVIVAPSTRADDEFVSPFLANLRHYLRFERQEAMVGPHNLVPAYEFGLVATSM